MKRTCLLLCFALALPLLSACAHSHRHPSSHAHGAPPVVTRPGPPPHAPAHGHRQKHHQHHDVELVFDSHLGVYIVVGWPDVYFHHDHFYRLVDGGWQVSLRIDDGWRRADARGLPPGLARKGNASAKAGKGHGPRGKGRGHAKGKSKGPHPAGHGY